MGSRGKYLRQLAHKDYGSNEAPMEGKKGDTAGITVSPMKVTWKWVVGDDEPFIKVCRELQVKGAIWTIRYPEVAPPNARYELVVDSTPTLLTAQQRDTVTALKAELQEVWQAERAILDAMLWLWTPLPRSEREAVIQDDGKNRKLWYTSTTYMKGAPFNIEIEVSVRYVDKRPSNPYEVKADIYMVDCDRSLQLKTINLPVVNGKANPNPLLEYLTVGNPFMEVASKLSDLANSISGAASSGGRHG